MMHTTSVEIWKIFLIFVATLGILLPIVTLYFVEKLKQQDNLFYTKGLNDQLQVQPNVEFLSTGTVLGEYFLASSIPGNPFQNIGGDGEDPDPQIQYRRQFVRRMMKDAWVDYSRWAWGDNELRPVSKTGRTGEIFGSEKLGATIVDSLDTLLVMNLITDYEKAREYVNSVMRFDLNTTVSVFETNIRFLGGLLAAYALTDDQLFKIRAIDIATRLLPAFNTPTGIPYSHVNILTGRTRGSNSALADFGSLHLEFAYLSKITGNPIFRQKVDKIRDFLKTVKKPTGLYSSHLDVIDGKFTDDHISIGAYGDSFYEYLLKTSIQLRDNEAKEMYDDAMDAFFSNGLIKISQQSKLLYIAEMKDGHIDDVVGHLACFSGGMLALGAYAYPNNSNSGRDAEAGRNFTNTCHESYIRTHSQIGPDIFRFSEKLEAEAGTDEERHYILRPEVIESYFILYRVTGESKYRDWAWDAAKSIQRYCKTGSGRGYSGIKNTNSNNPVQDDIQPSFFLAETLKYLYLIFSTNDFLPMEKWVFNTEAHPFPIFSDIDN